MDRARKAEPHASETMWHREVHKNLEGHLSRMNHMTPFIDNAVPKTAAMGGSSTSKKSQLKEDRLDAIEVENRRLLERIATIALTTAKGGDDEKAPKKSLHDGQRKREQERIYMENQAMLRRLQTVKPTLKQKDPKKGNKWRLKFVKSKEHKLSKSEREIETKVDGNAIHVKKASSRKGSRRNKVVPSQGEEIVPEPEPSQKTPSLTFEQPDASDAVPLLLESSSSATIRIIGATTDNDGQHSSRIPSPSEAQATEETQILSASPSTPFECAGISEFVEVCVTPAQSDATAESDASSEPPCNATFPAAAMDGKALSALTAAAPEPSSTDILEYEPSGAAQKATGSCSAHGDEDAANEATATDVTSIPGVPISGTTAAALASVVAEAALLTAVDHVLHGEAAQGAPNALKSDNADTLSTVDRHDDNTLELLDSADTAPPSVPVDLDDVKPAALKGVAQTLATAILTAGLHHVVVERTSPTKPPISPDEKTVQFEEDASSSNADATTAVSTTTLDREYDEVNDTTDGAGEILSTQPGPGIAPVGDGGAGYQSPSMDHQDDLYDDGDEPTGGATAPEIAAAGDEESSYYDEEPSEPVSAEVAGRKQLEPADDEADVYDDDLDNSNVHTNNDDYPLTKETNQDSPTETKKPYDVPSNITGEDVSFREGPDDSNTMPAPVDDVGYAYSDDEDSSESPATAAAVTAAQQLSGDGQGDDYEGGDDYEDDTPREDPHDDVYHAEFQDEHLEIAYADDGFDDGQNADEDGADYGDEHFAE
ncbi:hypothetical protein SDRG_15108 [Saprolegnia diclina VS20]|uniref:Uncharacterized protein n=1 Tax=Saprolegnia diclina (strain VS20) TaxID=1156394 RepID=T0Q157_SAPDV|nr:hypothetical protein SDRG_15108 [Saprolegnia diclina VS20]EQC27100.1 hypothetical protein SDRG_15108 [Saprolegnia diclina VS20]|eukprot:XP_008619494.1 hypothetical protein SDRG_15108 [Saprolegnia diclina VS20]